VFNFNSADWREVPWQRVQLACRIGKTAFEKLTSPSAEEIVGVIVCVAVAGAPVWVTDTESAVFTGIVVGTLVVLTQDESKIADRNIK
jgi:hypothetical protein